MSTVFILQDAHGNFLKRLECTPHLSYVTVTDKPSEAIKFFNLKSADSVVELLTTSLFITPRWYHVEYSGVVAA